MRPSTGPHRLRYGGQIDRTRRVAFRFDGKTYLSIGAAKLETDDQGDQKIVPTPQ